MDNCNQDYAVFNARQLGMLLTRAGRMVYSGRRTGKG
jgi:hypothetical protein